MSEDVKELENETPAETPEVEAEMPEEESTDTPLTEDDYYREKARADEAEKKAATALAQKEHYRKKAEEKKLAPQVETPQVSNDYLTREEGILLAQGYDQDDLDNLRRLAGNKKLTEVIEDPLFVAYQSQKKAKQRASKAQLGASTSSILKTSKPIEEMSDDEHKDLWLKTVGVK